MSDVVGSRRFSIFVATVAAVATLLLSCVSSGRPADAAVVHHLGFHGTVDGFTSWYGSYAMGSLGPAWCIDHGIPAPDPALAYEPTAPEVNEATRTAAAWLVGRHGYSTDPVTAAALMLALHDLMGAVYPSGRLDVDRLTPAQLASFGGHERAVIARARDLKAEASRRSVLRGPFQLALAADPIGIGERGSLRGRVTDANGQPVPGAIVLVSGDGATFERRQVETGGDGMIRLGFEATTADPTVVAHAVVPDLDLDAYAPTRRRAQRVVVPGQIVVEQTLAITTVVTPPPPGEVIVDKTGDATEVAPITGARFELRHPTGEVVAEVSIGDDGTSDPVEVEPGPYRLVETAAPPGYLTAAPLDIEAVSGETVRVEVHNLARPGSLSITKIDPASNAHLPGATLEVRSGASSGDGSTVVTTVETADRPVTVDQLAWGTYWIVELAAPAGYRLEAEPLEVFVEPGRTTSITVPNTAVEPEPPATSSTTTTSTSTTTSTTGTSTTLPAPPPSRQPAVELPRTGSTTLPTTLVGTGLVFLGLAMTIGADLDPDGRLRPLRRWRRPRRGPRRRGRARSSADGWRTRRRPPPPS